MVEARLELESLFEEEPIVDFRTHPLAIIVSQDCDLDWDFRARNDQAPAHKRVPTVLLVEVATVEEIRERGRETREINTDLWRTIEKNGNERYHILPAVLGGADAIGEGLPPMVIDFKRYFTLPSDELYARLGREAQRRCFLDVPHRDKLSQRFYTFHARIALPDEYA